MARELIEVSVILPCLNEEATVGICVQKSKSALEKAGLRGEILVVDNGSTDRSVQIATLAGARVIHESKRGYGSALMRGMRESRGACLVMADSDDSYDLLDLPRFVQPLRRGADIVMGNRFKGTILPGAMPWKNRYIGNPLLSLVLRLFFKTLVSDAHCGMRSLTREAFRALNLRMPGMEFASEMLIQAARANLVIEEIPITLHPARCERRSHLRPWRDGWQHLKLMLILSPANLFLIPGLFFFLVGLLLMAILSPGPLRAGGLYMGPHWMVLGSLSTLLGLHILSLYSYVLVYSCRDQATTRDRFVGFFMRIFYRERGFVCGSFIALFGLGINAYVAWHWFASGFGPLYQIHRAILGSTLTLLGVQLVFSSFFVDFLNDERNNSPGNSSDC